MVSIGMDDVKKERDFLKIDLDGVSVVFSTAEEDRSFNRHNESGINNLKSLEKDFSLLGVKYLNQVHSDTVYTFKLGQDDIISYEGDAIVTNEKNIAVGVFTADCVPVILVNEEKKVVAAIHSGWRGTFESITKKTLNKMVEEFDVDISKTKAFIGPHIRKCCYEVSTELKEKFLEKFDIEEEELFHDRNLSMEECILNDLKKTKLRDENIFSLNLCTHCEDGVKLYSYRKSVGTYGRLFSFVFIK